MREETRSRAVELVHTVVWAFFASCVAIIPLTAWKHRLALADLLIAIVALESLVLAFNAWPLRDWM